MAWSYSGLSLPEHTTNHHSNEHISDALNHSMIKYIIYKYEAQSTAHAELKAAVTQVMQDGSQTGVVNNDSQADGNDDSQTGVMNDGSQTGVMNDGSQTGVMNNDSQADGNDDSQTGVMNDDSQTGVMKDGN